MNVDRVMVMVLCQGAKYSAAGIQLVYHMTVE